MKITEILGDKPSTDLEKLIKTIPGAAYYNGKVNLTETIYVEEYPDLIWYANSHEGRNLRVQFGETKSFYLDNLDLWSMVGSPEIVNGGYSAINNKISNLEGIPKIITQKCDLSQNPKLISLEGIGKKVKRIGDRLYIPGSIKSNVLGLLLVDVDLITMSLKMSSARNQLFESITIINRHIKSGKDILECQEELISAGLKEFAKL